MSDLNMVPKPRFKIFTAPDLGVRPRLSVSGRVGPRPDREAFGKFDGEYCARNTLPSYLKNMKFRADESFHRGATALRDFYHMKEYFVVSKPLLDFFVDTFENDIEFSEVRVEWPDGRLSPESYFALKITRTINCIDPAISFKKDFHNRPIFFQDSVTRCELDASLAEEYANCPNGTYASYPNFRVGKVHLDEKKIPINSSLFRAAFWPAQLIGEVDFIDRLARVCGRGSYGNDFWALDLEDVDSSGHQWAREMR